MTPELALVENLSQVAGAWERQIEREVPGGLVVDGEVFEREIAGVGLLRFEDLGPGEWLTQRGEPAKVGRRRYLLDGEELLSVSRITDTLGKQGALVPWAERVSIEGTVRAIQSGMLDPAIDPRHAAAVVQAKHLGAEGVRDEAAQRGKAIHTVFYDYVMTGEFPKREDWHGDHWPWAQGAARVLLALNPEPELAELPVCNPHYRYAGRPDLICRCRWHGRWARLLLDWKTGRGRVYDSAHYQGRLYGGCLEPCQIEPVEDILIVGVDDSGGFELVRCEASELDALGLLSVCRSRKRINAGMAAQRRIVACQSRNRAVRG
jgi:hypothetical protein